MAHLVFIFWYDGNRHIDYYKNGVFQSSTAGSTNSALGWNRFQLGCINFGDAGWYLGTIEEFRIYNRILFPAEIKSIYYAQGNDNIVNGLVGRWLMNEKPDGQTATVANSVIDVSGQGNHGTPVNSPIYRGAPIRLVRPSIFVMPVIPPVGQPFALRRRGRYIPSLGGVN